MRLSVGEPHPFHERDGMRPHSRLKKCRRNPQKLFGHRFYTPAVVIRTRDLRGTPTILAPSDVSTLQQSFSCPEKRSSGHVKATVHVQNVTGDVGCHWRTEKQRGVD